MADGAVYRVTLHVQGGSHASAGASADLEVPEEVKTATEDAIRLALQHPDFTRLDPTLREAPAIKAKHRIELTFMGLAGYREEGVLSGGRPMEKLADKLFDVLVPDKIVQDKNYSMNIYKPVNTVPLGDWYDANGEDKEKTVRLIDEVLCGMAEVTADASTESEMSENIENFHKFMIKTCEAYRVEWTSVEDYELQADAVKGLDMRALEPSKKPDALRTAYGYPISRETGDNRMGLFNWAVLHDPLVSGCILARVLLPKPDIYSQVTKARMLRRDFLARSEKPYDEKSEWFANAMFADGHQAFYLNASRELNPDQQDKVFRCSRQVFPSVKVVPKYERKWFAAFTSGYSSALASALALAASEDAPSYLVGTRYVANRTVCLDALTTPFDVPDVSKILEVAKGDKLGDVVVASGNLRRATNLRTYLRGIVPAAYIDEIK